MTVLSNLMEVGMIAFPVWLVKDLQAKRHLKIMVVLAAWVRLPYVPTCSLGMPMSNDADQIQD